MTHRFFDIRSKSSGSPREPRLFGAVDLKNGMPQAELPQGDSAMSLSRSNYPSVLRKILLVLVFFSIILVSTVLAKNILTKTIQSKKELVMARLPIVVSEMAKSEEAMKALEFSAAQESIRAAISELDAVRESLGPPYRIMSPLARILPHAHPYVAAAMIIESTRELLSHLDKAAFFLHRITEDYPKSLFQPEGPSVAPFLEHVKKELEYISFLAVRISSFLLAASPLLDSDQEIGEFAKTLPQQQAILNDSMAAVDMLLAVTRGEKNFLLLFQNPAEIRPTGGFIGSYGTLKTRDGRIMTFAVDDIYNPDGQLEEKINVIPPKPLQWITPRWEARDANWFFDFPTSARKVKFFIERGLEERFHGVIAINPAVIEGILKIVGPIEMPEYKKVISDSNFWEETQYQTRAGKDRLEGQPKRFLVLFGPRLLDKLNQVKKADSLKLAEVFRGALAKKEMQFYFEDERLQAFADKKGWTGKIAPENSSQDYVAVVYTNIGGAKADFLTRQEITLETEIGLDGFLTNTLKIRRKHDGHRSKFSWFNSKNRTHVRVYVPKGSVILSASGGSVDPSRALVDYKKMDGYIYDQDVLAAAGVRMDDPKLNKVEISEENGKTVFASWMILNPGESRELTLAYRLPFRIGYSAPRYSAIIQKQSGINTGFSHTLRLPTGSVILSRTPGDPVESAWYTEFLEKDMRIDVQFLFPETR